MMLSLCVLYTFVLCLATTISANVIHSFDHNENVARPSLVLPHVDEPADRPSLDDYMSRRKSLLQQQFEMGFESDVTLTADEELANKIIMRAKNKELKTGQAHPYAFNPSRHIFEVLENVTESDLFKILKRMPKGGILHAHDTALCSADYLVVLTYWPNLWQCTRNRTIDRFLFSRQEPEAIPANDCIWTSVATERQKMGAEEYDEYVRTFFTLYDKNKNPLTQYRDINAVWDALSKTFMRVTPMLTYAPVWKAYYKQALKEMLADNVQYLEFRSTLPPVYDLNGGRYTEVDVVKIYSEALDEFKSDNPGFIGAKIIYAPVKFAPNASIQHFFRTIPKLQAGFPDFFAGFDMVGQEDPAPMIINFVENLLRVPKEVNFYLHAGETNWNGGIDLNLVDAVLLGTKRIGHGFGLIKHPRLMEIVKEKGIAIEINPISNQVLKLVEDQRNHIASTLFSQNFPLVVSSDDPSFWEVSPLTHDFYMAFLGMTSANSDLRTLKKLAKNSFIYSAMNDTEKATAFTKWQRKWDKFITDLVQSDEF